MKKISRVQELRIIDLALKKSKLSSSEKNLISCELAIEEAYKVSKNEEELEKFVCNSIYRYTQLTKK